MHQLHREELHAEPDLDRFFAAYLGEPVRQQLEHPLVRFSTWPSATRQVLRSLCTYFAEAIPEADHVIRQDVDTRGHAPQVVEGELLLYFGFQLGAQRRQFIGVAQAHRSDAVVFVLYIAGATDELRREELITAKDPGRMLDRRVIASVADLDRFAEEAAPVLRHQRDALIVEKGVAASGFNPCFCQRRWNREKRLPEKEARDKVWAYWARRGGEIPSEQKLREFALMKENNHYRHGRAVAYVRDHLPVEDAYALALSEHA